MGVGRVFGDLGSGIGGPRSVLGGFGPVLGWISGGVRAQGDLCAASGPIFGRKIGGKTARPTQDQKKQKINKKG